MFSFLIPAHKFSSLFSPPPILQGVARPPPPKFNLTSEGCRPPQDLSRLSIPSFSSVCSFPSGYHNDVLLSFRAIFAKWQKTEPLSPSSRFSPKRNLSFMLLAMHVDNRWVILSFSVSYFVPEAQRLSFLYTSSCFPRSHFLL